MLLTYTWSNSNTGTSTTVNPSVTTTYSYSVTDGFGCVNSGTVNVMVNSNAITLSSNTTICQGSSYNLVANGAGSYIWNTGWPFSVLAVSPTVSTVYSVIGIDANNCVLTNSVSVNVNPAPNVFASSNKDAIGRGEAVTLSATGANTYIWNNPVGGNPTGASVTQNLSIDIPYTFTVNGTNTNGCSNVATITIVVEKCAGTNELAKENLMAQVFPNPSNGIFIIKTDQFNEGTVEVLDCTGRVMLVTTIENNSTEINAENLANGIYYVKVTSNELTQVIKVVKN